MRHITPISGGGGSWLTAGVVQKDFVRPGDTHELFFSDTLYEDADAYRFLIEGSAQVFGRKLSWIPEPEDFPSYMVEGDFRIEDYHGAPLWRAFLAQIRARALEDIPELTWSVEGRDPWEIYRDERFLGNSGVDPCSKVLKREDLDAWILANVDPADAVFYFGIGTAERHRYEHFDPETEEMTGIRPRFSAIGRDARAPLIGRIEGDTSATFYMRKAGIRPPRLYAWAAHNNCGGMCCKAGIRHWSRRFLIDRERFNYDAIMEARMIDFLGRYVTFLMDRRGGGNRPISLMELGQRILSDPKFKPPPPSDGDDGCGCMVIG